MDKYVIPYRAPQVPPFEAPTIAQGLTVELGKFLLQLLVELDTVLDKRLVRTFVQLIAVIVTFRDRANGLLLSELGGYLLSPRQAPAGTKRISNLLHSASWSATIITRFLWQRATAQLQQWEQTGQAGLVLWDESVLEKPESRHLEELGPTRSVPRGSLDARQTRLLLPTGCAHFCAGDAVAGGVAREAVGEALATLACRPTLVDQPGTTCFL